MPPLYELENVKRFYKGYPALEIETLRLRKGSIVGLIGPNGSGKSTLLKLLAFLESPSEGIIRYRGKPAEPFSERIRSHVTLLTQEPYLMKRTVFKNVSYGLRIQNDQNRLKKRVHDALALVGLSAENFAGRYWYELSTGEAQRVALAARLILKPEVLLLDEPTASVDAASVQIIKDTALMARRTWGTTLVVASHDWEWLYSICDDICHLFRGRIFGTGRENFVFGPWRRLSSDRWYKPLSSGERFGVCPPPHENAVALLHPDAIGLTALDSSSEKRRGWTVAGVISRLVAEKSDEFTLAVVRLGNLAINVRLSRNQVMDRRLYPGVHVRLHYDPTDIRWY